MKSTPLIKSLQESEAAGSVGATSVAGHATPLVAQMVRRTRTPKIKVHSYASPKAKPARKLGIKEAFEEGVTVFKESEQFDQVGVISKLKNLEKVDQAATQPLATFGLEDEQGNIVKVSVPVDQGADFEKALQAALHTSDDTEAEIAEVLFDLKDNFDIIGVEWGDVVEDEEELPTDADTPADIPDEVLQLDDQPAPEDTSSVASLLTQVIDMMKADAEARSADAKARKADAEAKEAEYISIQAAAKVRQEEQILDMESHEKKQKEVSKEAKRLAKLAKWKHDLADNNDTEREDMTQYIPSYDDVTGDTSPDTEFDIPVPKSVEDEERVSNKTADNLAAFLLNRVK